jgi:hypothetical protein
MSLISVSFPKMLSLQENVKNSVNGMQLDAAPVSLRQVAYNMI